MIISNQPTKLEEVVTSTVQGLRQLEDMLGYEFQETTETIEKLYELQQTKAEALASAQDYAEASGKGVAAEIVALNKGYALPTDKTVSSFFQSVEDMFAPMHDDKAVF